MYLLLLLFVLFPLFFFEFICTCDFCLFITGNQHNETNVQDLLKTLYVDQELTFLKDQDLAAGGSADKTDSTYDARNGVRCIRISPDGKHLASGDRAGNIR